MIETIIATILCSVLYRLGGWGRPFRSWMRDWLIPLPICIWLWLMMGVTTWWVLLITYGLVGASLTTYWDSLLGYDNFYLHGAVIALGCVLTVVNGDCHLLPFLLRVGVLGGSMGLLCKLAGNHHVEEFGRGALIGLTLPLLLI